MDHLPLMARFNRWVNAQFHDSVAKLSDAAYREDSGLFFGSVHATLNHLLLVDRLWTRRIEGAPHRLKSLDQILHDDFDSLRAAQSAEDEHLIELVDGLTPARLQEPVVYRRMIGEGDEEIRAGHILLALFNHQTHHRGQVHAVLTRHGIVPPGLDVPYFLDAIGEAGPPGTIKAA